MIGRLVDISAGLLSFFMLHNEKLKKGGELMLWTAANLMLAIGVVTTILKLYMILVQVMKNSSHGHKIRPAKIVREEAKRKASANK